MSLSSATTFQFSTAATKLYFDASIRSFDKIVSKEAAIIITDENIHAAHGNKLKGWKTIVIKAGERYKNQRTVDTIIQRLIVEKADRKNVLVGLGGGVITDITGYVASVYMRGVSFGFIPTTVLAMVDASIGGKNGIDIGIYKNMVGVIRQPSFILHDISLLKTLPQGEWINGFAEIIKHACIKDASMFRELEGASLRHYQRNHHAMASLIERNARIKIKVVKRDEFEKSERRLLNFGHTLAHAIENQYRLSHGQAVAIGMTYAAHLSQHLTGFKHTATLVSVLEKYGLPAYYSFNHAKAMEILSMDKKRERSAINYILLEKIGKAVIQNISLNQLSSLIAGVKKIQ